MVEDFITDTPQGGPIAVVVVAPGTEAQKQGAFENYASRIQARDREAIRVDSPAAILPANTKGVIVTGGSLDNVATLSGSRVAADAALVVASGGTYLGKSAGGFVPGSYYTGRLAGRFRDVPGMNIWPNTIVRSHSRHGFNSMNEIDPVCSLWGLIDAQNPLGVGIPRGDYAVVRGGNITAASGQVYVYRLENKNLAVNSGITKTALPLAQNGADPCTAAARNATTYPFTYSDIPASEFPNGLPAGQVAGSPYQEYASIADAAAFQAQTGIEVLGTALAP